MMNAIIFVFEPMAAGCENPVVKAILQDPVIQRYIGPKCNEMRSLEAKGIDKTLDDLMRIREIRHEVEELVGQLLRNAAVVDLGSNLPGIRTSGIDREQMVKLTDVHTDASSFATCDAGMFTSPWSREFVHGADATLHVGDLAQKILRPSEHIAGVKRITWRKPTATNLKLAVYARSFPDMDMSGYNFDGALTTSEGRTLTFFAMPDEESPIRTHMAESNPFAANILCPCDDCRKMRCGATLYRLHELPVGLNTALDHDFSLRMSTTLELLTLGIAHSNSEAANDRSQVLKLLAGVNDLVIPESSRELCQGVLAVRLFKDAAKRGKSGMELIPFEYRFPHMSKDRTGIVAVTRSVTCAENVLDGCQNGGSMKSHRGRR